MKPLYLLPALAALCLSIPAHAGPKCPAPGAGGVSTNWGVDFRERVHEIFDAAKTAAGDGLDPKLALIYINDLPKHGGTRMVDGSPLSALEKGTLGLETDAVIYTFGIFEIACDEAQLATFMLHEMKHIQRGADGKNHLDRVNECQKKILKDWLDRTDVTPYYPASKTGNPAADDAADEAGNKAVRAAFQKEKAGEVAAQCVKPVENEADAFAFARADKLPYKVESNDPNRDARVLAFQNAEKWIDALGLKQDDPAHGTLGERAADAKRVATEEAMKKRQAEQERRLQSLQPNF
jgi:hypothetical protein